MRTTSFLSLWRQFLPLSLSDVIMALSDPLIHMTLAHLPDARSNLAALGVAKSQVVFFESPIIMLLHASNAMAPWPKSREALKKFMLISILALISLLFLLTLPSVYGMLSQKILSLDEGLSAKARTVLLYLILWPAIIGWRRFYQGILIRTQQDRTIGKASLVRILVVSLVLLLGYSQRASGLELSAWALLLGILSEALFVTWAAHQSRSLLVPLAEEKPSSSAQRPEDLRGVWQFYWPLANSMILVWGGRALLIGVISRAHDSSLALAAWPMAWGIVLLAGNTTRMVQQIIIRHRFRLSDPLLLRFALSVGVVFSFVLLILSGTPWGFTLISQLVGQDTDLLYKIAPVLLICSGVPLLVALQNALQGLLMSEGQTRRINLATWIGIATMLILAILGVKAGYAGAITAAYAMLFSLVMEILFLALGTKSVFTFKNFNSILSLSR